MNGWLPIATRPQAGSNKYDVFARRYNNLRRAFECRRFIDCFSGYFAGDDNHVKGLPDDWEPTHWMPAPKPPTPREEG
jgi:hypothetical protein